MPVPAIGDNARADGLRQEPLLLERELIEAAVYLFAIIEQISELCHTLLLSGEPLFNLSNRCLYLLLLLSGLSEFALDQRQNIFVHIAKAPDTSLNPAVDLFDMMARCFKVGCQL